MRVWRARRAGGVSPLFPADTSRLTPAARLSGFTLVELLVVMLIMMILTAIAVWTVDFSMSAERSRSAARQVQSYLEGARDRAIYARKPRGVRFLLDTTLVDASNNGRTATSMVYIGETDDWGDGSIHMERLKDGSPEALDVLIVKGDSQTNWINLNKKGLLIAGSRIRIPKGEFGAWYTVSIPTELANETENKLRLTTPYRTPPTTPDSEVNAFSPGSGIGPIDYLLELPPRVLPDQEPSLLPQGIVIDLDRSKTPLSWTPSTLNRMDVMFSPRGTVTGSAAAQGLIHFYIAETADVDRLQAAGFSATDIPSDTWTDATDMTIGDRVIVTLFTHTGAISTHRVNPTGAGNIAGDPFRFAELGEVAGQ